MCYGDEDCTVDCSGGRRRRSVLEEPRMASGDVEDIQYQDNGLPGILVL